MIKLTCSVAPDNSNNYKDSKGLEVEKCCVGYTYEFPYGLGLFLIEYQLPERM